MLTRDIILKLEGISKKYQLDFLVLFDLKSSSINLAYYKLDDDIKIDSLRGHIEQIVKKEFNLINLSDKNSYLIKEVVYKKGFKIYVRDEQLYKIKRNNTFLHSHNILELVQQEY